MIYLLKSIIAIIFFMLIINNDSYSQLINKWEIADTDTIYYFNNTYPITKNISYFDKNDISIIGQYYKEVSRTFTTKEQIKVTLKTNSYIWLASRYSGLNNKKEVIYYDTNQTDDHWKSIAHPSKNIYAIVGDSISFLGHFNRIEYKYFSLLMLSNDGGNSWERIVGDSNKIFCDVSMCDSNNGIIYQTDTNNYFNNVQTSEFDTLLITTDSWKTYTKKALPENTNRKLHCITPTTYIVFCKNPETYKDYLSITTDGGNNWFNSSYPDFYIKSIKFVSENRFFVGGYKMITTAGDPIPRIAMSSDFGLTWNYSKLFQNELKPDFGRIWGIDFYDSLNGIAAGNDLIYKTSDAGLSWKKEILPFKFFPDGSNIITIVDIAYPDKNFLLAISNMKHIITSKNEQILLKPEFFKIRDHRYQKVNDIKIQWTSINGANKYRLKIDSTNIDHQDYDFEHPLIDTILTDTSIILNDLSYGCQYAGWVKAFNDTIESDWAESRNLFATIAKEGDLYPPDLLQPVQGYLAKPPEITLIWTKVPNADGYNLSIYDLSKSQTIFYQNIADTNYTASFFESSNSYFIRMSSYNKDTSSGLQTFILYTSDESTDIIENLKLINNELFLFPNPVNESCKMIIYSDISTTAFINIFTLLGTKVSYKEIQLKYGDNIIQLNTELLGSGIYGIEVIGSEDIKRGFFIKQ